VKKVDALDHAATVIGLPSDTTNHNSDTSEWH
jgi:hypothetical protein